MPGGRGRGGGRGSRLSRGAYHRMHRHIHSQSRDKAADPAPHRAAAAAAAMQRGFSGTAAPWGSLGDGGGVGEAPALPAAPPKAVLDVRAEGRNREKALTYVERRFAGPNSYRRA